MLKCINGFNNFTINFRGPISDKDIDSFEHAKQYFSDCYLMSTLETLSHTPNGRKILKEQIQYDNGNPNLINCYLYKSNGEREKYAIPAEQTLKGYEKLYAAQDNKIIRSMDISVAEYEKKYLNAEKEAKNILRKSEREIELIKDERLKKLEAEMDMKQKEAEQRIKTAQESAVKEVTALASEMTIKALKEVLAKSLDKKSQDKLIDESIKAISNL